MRIDDLIGQGLPPRVVSLWRADGFLNLLPLQIEAIKQYGLLDGKDLLICGPTSSGKTFCGELAALRAIKESKKAIFLVPLKAIADEKYDDFKKRYRKLKLKILIVSSDYPENKQPFINGNYDIAIVVYEMFNSVTATNLRVLESVGVVIFDEFQLITSIDRGIVYESVLAKVRYLKESIQIIALIGGLTECKLFEKWLAIPLLNASNRPVELHRGVLFNGRFTYKRFNDCQEGIEYLNINDAEKTIIFDETGISGDLINAISFLIDNDEQVLVFVSSRMQSQALARSLAGIFDLKSAESTITSLEDLPDTIQKASLMDCLKKAIGFHNAELSMAYRHELEEGFRSGDIRIMICTTTLAMGVNLPSKNVFIEPRKYYDGISGAPSLRPLMLDDYNQIAGRAGRLGQADRFGRAVIIANDENDREHIREYYLDGSAGAAVKLFDSEKLAALTLGWICCGMIKDYDDARKQLKACLRGYMEGFENNIPTRMIDYLNMHGFITLKGCRLICTSLGKAAVTYNIELNSAAAIKDGFIKYGLDDKFLSWLYYLTEIPECRRNLLYRRSFSFDIPVTEYIRMILTRTEEDARGPLEALIENPDPNVEPSRVNTLMMLADIIQPIPTIELETKYHAGWGRLKKIGEFYANIMRTATEIGKSNGLNKTQVEFMIKCADCLQYGIPEKGLLLIKLKPKLEREFVLRLINAGIISAEDIAGCNYDILLSLLPEKVASEIYHDCQDRIEGADKREPVEMNYSKPALKTRKIGARYEVMLTGKSVSLQPRLFKYFQKLYNADHPDGWVDKNVLDNGLNQVKYIYKLRKALEGVDDVMIESDGAGRYRLRMEESKSLPQSIKVAP